MQLFEDHLADYLLYGMTPEQYWEGDCTLAVAYRRAYRLRNQQRNQELWLQGAYFYRALCCVAPVLHAFAKRGTKPDEYPSEPFALNEREAIERNEQKSKSGNSLAIAAMQAWAISFNKKRHEQQEEQAKQSASEVSADG